VKFATAGEPSFRPRYGLDCAGVRESRPIHSGREEKCHDYGERRPIHTLLAYGRLLRPMRAVTSAQAKSSNARLKSAAMPAFKEPTIASRQRRTRSGANVSLAGRTKAEFFADIDELNAAVHSGGRMRGIAQLFLTHADRLEHGRIDVKWIDQSIADRFCSPLT
jgi:hypothetical protein